MAVSGISEVPPCPHPRPARLSRPLLAALALVAALVPPSPSTAAHAAGPSYVALGDSYASGVGTRSYIDDGTELPALDATPTRAWSRPQKGYALNFQACSGATIADVTSTQLGALTATTSYVTISVGGNDAGFADVLTECAQPGWAGDCDGAIDNAQAFINNTLPGRLTTLYASIRAGRRTRRSSWSATRGSSWARTATPPPGSPRRRRPGSTRPPTCSTAGPRPRLGPGFRFANPTSRFIGHAVCDDVEWINGLSNPISESYHPNSAGRPPATRRR